MLYDIIVVGAGPAGLTAALYALRADKKVLVIEKSTPGGQITYSPKVENYPGFMEMSGNEFADLMLDQILSHGADFELGTVVGIKDGETKTVLTEDAEFEGKAVIIATGVKHRLLGLEGEKELIGNGISFCAVCDGAFYKGKTVAVVGGGNSALQEAILLSDNAKTVYVVQNLEKLTGEAKLQEVIAKKENVKVILCTTVNAIETDKGNICAVEIIGGGKRSRLEIDGMFVAIGLIPENKPFEHLAKLNEWGYFDSGEDCRTATNGIFVAGDCRSKRIRQITTATADGAVAALAACEWLDG